VDGEFRLLDFGSLDSFLLTGETLHEASIPIMKPRLPSADAIYPYLKQIDESRVYSNYGPLHTLLTERLASYFAVLPSQLLVLTNGTVALQGAIATSTSSGSCWSLPSWTFVATAQAIVATGNSCYFLDIEQDTWALGRPDFSDVDGCIAVAPFGDRLDIDPMFRNQFSINKPLVIDAASCFDAYKDISLPTDPSTAIMISLHATKLVSTGEGGILIASEDWITEIKKWSNFGFLGDRIARGVATNTKASEYQAAVGLASLDEWRLMRASWVDRISAIKRAVEHSNWKLQPAVDKGYVTSTCIAQFDSAQSKQIVTKMFSKHGISTRNWWGDGVHMMPAFADTSSDILTNTKRIAETTLGIPCFSDISDEEVDLLGRALNEARMELLSLTD